MYPASLCVVPEPDDATPLLRRLSRDRKVYVVILIVLVGLAAVNVLAGNQSAAVLYLAPIGVALVLVVVLTLATRRRP